MADSSLIRRVALALEPGQWVDVRMDGPRDVTNTQKQLRRIAHREGTDYRTYYVPHLRALHIERLR